MHYKRCSRCVLSAEFPRIKFNSDGVCNYCLRQQRSADTGEILESAKSRISELFSRSRSFSDYDAVVCYSGGKDSTYTLDLAVNKYGLRVLAFTLDNGFMSEEARKNIETVIDTLGVDHWVFKPGVQNYCAIIKASVENAVYSKTTLTRISAGCNSCISMVNTAALRLALEKRIPFILAGFTLGQIPANSIIFKNHQKFLEESRLESLGKLRAAVGSCVDNYFTISSEQLNAVQSYPHNINLLCVENITEADILQKVRNLGWVDPGDVDGCSSNCTLNTVNNYLHERIFNYNPYELELSHLVREGFLTRSEALNKMADRPTELILPILKKLNVEESAIDRVKWVYANAQ